MQSTLENAIQETTGEPARVLGSGRTDAGAHAARQVVAFSSATRLDTGTLTRAINAHLPRDISVAGCMDVPLDFNPRRDARSRTYRYLIWNRPVRSPFFEGRAAHVARLLSEEWMDRAAKKLVGRHDLGAFIPVQTDGSRERTIYAASCIRDSDIVVIELEATGFMKQMVRTIAGTLIRVGLGKMSVDEFGAVLASKDRSRAGDTAPACGLYLVGVHYPDLDMTETIEYSSGVYR